MHVTPFGDAMTVPTMRAGEFVAVVKIHADACSNRFLSSIEMDKAWNIATSELHMNTLLKLPNRLHDAVRFQEISFAELHRSCSLLKESLSRFAGLPLSSNNSCRAANAMTFSTSIEKGPLLSRRKVTLWFDPNSISRSPSRAITPCVCVTV